MVTDKCYKQLVRAKLKTYKQLLKKFQRELSSIERYIETSCNGSWKKHYDVNCTGYCKRFWKQKYEKVANIKALELRIRSLRLVDSHLFKGDKYYRSLRDANIVDYYPVSIIDRINKLYGTRTRRYS